MPEADASDRFDFVSIPLHRTPDDLQQHLTRGWFGAGRSCPLNVLRGKLQYIISGTKAVVMYMENILERLAERYRAEGFSVIVHPTIAELPEFLGNMPVDLIARKGDRIIAVKADEHGVDNDPVKMDIDLGALSVVKLMREADRLLHPDTTLSALVMAWAAFEGSARLLLQRDQKPDTVTSDFEMIDRLWERDQIAAQEYTSLRFSVYLRNAIVHGSWPGEIPSQLVPSILRTAKRLLKIAGVTVPTPIAGASATIIRKAVNDIPPLLDLVERANSVLGQLLGSSRAGVSADWDIAREMRDRPVIVLRLSDATGVVAATFEPNEILDEERFQARLSRLWGDLLEIRSHRQVERLLDAHPESGGSSGS